MGGKAAWDVSRQESNQAQSGVQGLEGSEGGV